MKSLLKIRLYQYCKQFEFFEKQFTKNNIDLESKEYQDFIDEAMEVKLKWPEDIKKPVVGVVKDFYKYKKPPKRVYWTKFQRYLINNDIPYDFYDINKSDWIENADKFDVIVWRTDNDPSVIDNARSKIFLLEQKLKKMCYPSFENIWSYEDKVRQYYLLKTNNISCVDTFISSNKEECLQYVENARYPIVSKLTAGSGSWGVHLIKNKTEARRFIRKVFGMGKSTYWSYIKQKDYVYFQPLLEDVKFDLRIIVVGNKFLGYYRMKPDDDFRASGAGLFVKKELPEEAMLLAKEVNEKFNSDMIAVDMIKSEKTNKFFVIETSIFIQVDTAQQLQINKIPGYYQFENDKFAFVENKVWLQELVLHEIMKKWIENY